MTAVSVRTAGHLSETLERFVSVRKASGQLARMRSGLSGSPARFHPRTRILKAGRTVERRQSRAAIKRASGEKRRGVVARIENETHMCARARAPLRKGLGIVQSFSSAYRCSCEVQLPAQKGLSGATYRWDKGESGIFE